jgi:hypothetical protein
MSVPGPVQWYHFNVFHIDIYPSNISDSGNVCCVLKEVKTNSEPAVVLTEEHTGRSE